MCTFGSYLSQKRRPSLIKSSKHGEILQVLYEAGSPGVLPKDLATKLARFEVTRHQISRRLLRMNKLLEKEFGEHVAEKRGWAWALTSFTVEVWGEVEDGT